MLFLSFVFKDMGCVVGLVDGSQLDLAHSSLGGGGCRWRAQIQELEGSGCSPGRWVTADRFILSLGTSVYFDSFQSQRAMGIFQLAVMFEVFLDRRWSATRISDGFGFQRS
jgi:hypothetical protein